MLREHSLALSRSPHASTAGWRGYARGLSSHGQDLSFQGHVSMLLLQFSILHSIANRFLHQPLGEQRAHESRECVFQKSF